MIPVLYSVTMFVALTGNLLLIFIVRRRPEMRTITSFVFVNMAAADLLVTVTVMPVTMAIPYTEMKWLTGIIGHITCKVVYFGFHVSIGASILSLTLMAMDRYLAVCFPLRGFTTFRRAKVLSVVIWLTSMIVMIPAAVLWKIEKSLSTPGVYCQPAFQDLFGDSEKGMTGYYSYLFLLTYLIPLLMISVLYGMVIRELWLRKKPGVILSKTEGHQEAMKRKVVRTLVIVTAAFALCWLPTQTYHLILAFNLNLHASLPRYVFFVCMWSGHANSAFNPWLYMLLTDKFRMALREVLLRQHSGNRNRSFRAQSSTRYTTVRENTSVRRHPPNHVEKGEGSLKEQTDETSM